MPQRGKGTRRFLATVLFTDIVGSTERASVLGDRAWRDLIENHNAVVRRELKAFGGREMDTAGDGFFAVFETPERAVSCAEHITSAVVPLGIAVRAGVHMGECEVIGGKVGGITVTIGARIAALAGAGEVLVSGSVRDLMTGSGQRFEGGEEQRLKGVVDRWRIYRLVPEPVSSAAFSERRTSIVPLYTRPQRRRLVGVIAAVTVLVLAIAGGYVLTRPEPTVTVGENAVGVIGPGHKPRVSAAVEVGQRPSAIAAGFGSVWVTNSTDDSVSRIDRHADNAVPINIESGSSPAGVAVGAGAVWVANSGNATVSRIDPVTSRWKVIPVAPGPTGIVVAFGSVWVTNALDAKVTEIDPDTSLVRKVVPIGAGPTGIAAGGGYLWVTNQGDGTVTRFDPKTYVKDPAVKVGSGPVGIAVADGAAWVANNLDGSLSRIDIEEMSVTSRTLAKGGGAYGVAAHGSDVWVSNEYAGTLMRVAAGNFLLGATVPLDGAPLGLGFVGDDLWFTSAGGGSALHRGGILTMVGEGVDGAADPPVFDPSVSYAEMMWRLAALTNDGLVGLRRAGGVEGAVLVPDLATSLPAPTDHGLTYTFHLRKGVQYSTGAPVLAGDVRRGIERTVVHPDTAPSAYYADAVVGADVCQDAAIKALDAKESRPDCDLSRGINADDRTGTVTFHLRKPSPEFLYQLALPNASFVPQDTPVDLAPGAALPATGPYQVRSYAPKQDAGPSHPARHGRLQLVRNPHFHVWSPAAQPDGYVDQVVLDTGYSEKEAEERVTGGRADVLWIHDALTDVDKLSARYGSQIHSTAGLWLRYLFLNATRPPFNNADARRAVAFVLGRQVLAGGASRPGPVTCQLIPPDFAGYRPYCPFTLGSGADGQWIGPNLLAARKLVKKSGTQGARVVVSVVDEPDWRQQGKHVVQFLVSLGYHASLAPHETDYSDPGHDWDVGLINWNADYPAASQYVAMLASCDEDIGKFNLSRYCDAEIDKQIAAALALQVADPGGANDAWAAIDKKVVDAAAVIPFNNNVRQDLVSRRVGNVLVQVESGLLISQLWVQ